MALAPGWSGSRNSNSIRIHFCAIQCLIVSGSSGTLFLGSIPTAYDTGGKAELSPPPSIRKIPGKLYAFSSGQGSGSYNQLLHQNHRGRREVFQRTKCALCWANWNNRCSVYLSGICGPMYHNKVPLKSIYSLCRSIIFKIYDIQSAIEVNHELYRDTFFYSPHCLAQNRHSKKYL